jgi:isomerase DpgB
MLTSARDGIDVGIDDRAAVAGLRIDGREPASIASVTAVEGLCDQAEDHRGPGIVALHVSGAPEGSSWLDGLNVALVSKWERALRRLERLARPTLAVARGDCGGIALDVLLATDVRIAAPDLRLLVCADSEATWPGMALFRLGQQAGPARIRQALLFGTPIEASEALALGLIGQLTDDLEGALATTAESLRTWAGAELAIRRHLMFDAAATSFEDALGSHLAACDRAVRRNSGGALP